LQSWSVSVLQGFGTACTATLTVVTCIVAAIHNGVLDSFSQHSGKSCLRDILEVTSHPELLPTAFDLSTLPGMSSSAAETASAGKAANSVSKVASGSGRTSNNAVVAAAVAAAAAVELETDEDGDVEDGYNNDLNYSDMEDDLMNNAAAAAAFGFGAEEAIGLNSSYANTSTSSSKTTAPATPAGLVGPLRQLAAADVVVANIQQLSTQRLEALFPRDYFDLIIMDEAHHAAARTWGAVLHYFAAAAKVNAQLCDIHCVKH
jgi:hypothetical protein